MRKIAILVDLELDFLAGGHVKFWEKISHSIKNSCKDFHLTVFFLGKKYNESQIGKNVTFLTLKPILSSKVLKPLGIDADTTDLFPINLRLFFMLKKFDLIHSTDQLFTMAKTALFASKYWKIPLTTSLHTDTPSYTEYYVKKIFEKFPRIFRFIFLKKLGLHQKIARKQKVKMNNYLKYCQKGMINDQLSSSDFNFTPDTQEKISKLSRGVDRKIFKKIKINKTHLMKKYGISKEDKIILFCGRIHELKGVFLLSKAHKILVKEMNLVSVLAGQNIHGDKCIEIGGNRIKLIGHKNQNEIAKLYNLCDLFVFPSKFEMGPQVVLEAKSCGAIPIVYPSGGGKRIYKNGVDGIIIDNYDSKVWAKKIGQLLNDQRKTNYMKQKILNEFRPLSWNKIFQKYFLKEWNKILK